MGGACGMCVGEEKCISISSNLSNKRSKASSKTVPPHGAI